MGVLKCLRLVSLNFINSPSIYWVLLCTLDPVLRAVVSQRVNEVSILRDFYFNSKGRQEKQNYIIIEKYYIIIEKCYSTWVEKYTHRKIVYILCMSVLSVPVYMMGAAEKLFGGDLKDGWRNIQGKGIPSRLGKGKVVWETYKWFFFFTPHSKRKGLIDLS